MPRIYKAPARDAMIASLKVLDKPTSIPELCELFPGMGRSNIDRLMREAHSKGLVRIAGWRRNVGTSGRISPLWAIPDGRPDAIKPKVDRDEVHRQSNRRYNRTHGAVIAFKRQLKRTGIHPSVSGFVYKPKAKPLQSYRSIIHRISDKDDDDE